MPRITSHHNARIKSAARLVSSSRERAKSRRCVLEGEHLVRAYVERHGAPETVIIAESALINASVRDLLERIPERDTLVVGERVWADLGQIPLALGVVAVVAA